MEDHFETLLYLVVGVVYFLINNTKSRDVEKETLPHRPSKHQPTLADDSIDGAKTLRNDTQETLVAKPLLRTDVKKVLPRAVHSTHAQLATQQFPSPKKERLLYRQNGWRKAIIMGELIQPYS